MDQAELDDLATEWRKTLRLRDWDVKVKLKRIFDLHEQDILGECNWVLSKKCAVVGVLDPQDYDPAFVRPYDPEQTLVHELLHLHFAPFTTDDGPTYEQEQAIDCIAGALVEAKRKPTPP